MRAFDVARFMGAAAERRRAAARLLLASVRARVPSAAGPANPPAAGPAKPAARGPIAETRATPPPPVPVAREPLRGRAGGAPAASDNEAGTLRRLLSDPASLGAAFAAAEILGKPVALRDP